MPSLICLDVATEMLKDQVRPEFLWPDFLLTLLLLQASIALSVQILNMAELLIAESGRAQGQVYVAKKRPRIVCGVYANYQLRRKLDPCLPDTSRVMTIGSIRDFGLPNEPRPSTN